MELTVSEYCEQYKKNIRYIQRLLKNNRTDLMPDVQSCRKVSGIYFLNVSPPKKAEAEKVS